MQRLIFRKFLNIKIVVKNMESEKESNLYFGKTYFDTLFDIYLKPLKSKNTRKIFQVLAREESVDTLTTLDIQTKLDEIGIDLSKKEINGWLHSLNTAGLASKEESRGKPTTIDYDDKYTFDHWGLTDLGAKIAENLPYLLRNKPILAYNDTEKILRELSEMEFDRRERTLQNLAELNVVIKILRYLLEMGCESNKSKLMKMLGISREEVDRLISKYSNQDLSLIFRKPREQSLISKLLMLMHTSPRTDEKLILTEEGKRLAEAFQPE